MLKDGDEKPNVPSTIIAEKAVERLDQLQASEKLIAGIHFVLINIYIFLFKFFAILFLVFFFFLQNLMKHGKKN